LDKKTCKLPNDQLQSPAKSQKAAQGRGAESSGSQNQACPSGHVDGAEEKMARHLMRAGERGQALIEYVFILMLVAMVVVVVLVIFGPQLGNAFSTITHGL
jgi:Flp pilus assembly pilin Flp